jgi:hypothetical protein
MKTKSKILPQLEAYQAAKSTLVDLYKTEDGKSFVHHLVYSYNVEKPKFILFSKSTLFDCLTRSVLLPVSTREMPASKEIIDLHAEIKEILSKDETADVTDLKNKINDMINSYVVDHSLIRIAMRSDHTNKILGSDEFQALEDFIDEQIKSGNTTIKSMMNVLSGKTNPHKRKDKKKSKDHSSKDFDLSKGIERLKEKFNRK